MCIIPPFNLYNYDSDLIMKTMRGKTQNSAYLKEEFLAH